MANLKRVLWHLVGGTRGGAMRVRILAIVHERPSNTNQLALELGADYKTIQHHLRVLKENRLLDVHGSRYGLTYFASAELEASWGEFEDMVRRLTLRRG
ncbi:MAG: ArsR/SmtB family transcription factor [Thermoplasmatota archaeon]